MPAAMAATRPADLADPHDARLCDRRVRRPGCAPSAPPSGGRPTRGASGLRRTPARWPARPPLGSWPRRRQHLDAQPGGGGEVDVVDPDPVAGDHPQLAAPLQQAGRDGLDSGQVADALRNDRLELGQCRGSTGSWEDELEPGSPEAFEARMPTFRQRSWSDGDQTGTVACVRPQPSTSGCPRTPDLPDLPCRACGSPSPRWFRSRGPRVRGRRRR